MAISRQVGVMIAAGLLFVSLIPLLVLSGLFLWSWRRNYLLRTVILGATLIHEIILVVFPVLYSLFTDFSFEGKMRVTVGANDLFLVMAGESVFILMFALSFLIGFPHTNVKGSCSNGSVFDINKVKAESLILKVLIIAGCIIYSRSILGLDSTNNLGVGGTIDQVVRWFRAVFWFTSLAACAIVITRRRRLFMNQVWTLISFVPMLALLLIGFFTGIRGRIVWVISLFVLMGLLNGQRKFVAFGTVLCIILLPIFTYLGGDYRGVTNQYIISNSEKYDVLIKLYEEATKLVLRDIKETGNELLYGFAKRAGGPRNSVVLYKDYEDGGGGLSTYLGSFFFPIPRLLWSEKPMAGSVDGSEKGSAIYKVMDKAYGEASDMGPILASAHAYWEGGWSWLVVAGFITGLIWNIIFNRCKHLQEGMATIIALTFAAALLIDGLLTMLTPLYAIIIAGWQSVLPILIIYKGILLTLPRKRVWVHTIG